MNIHLLFVHFPIGLLVFYGLLELAYPFLKKYNISWIYNTKLFLLFAGLLAAIPTIITGDMAGDIIGETKLVETHATLAVSTIFAFSIIAGAYIVRIIAIQNWFTRFAENRSFVNYSMKLLRNISSFILNTYVLFILSIIALILITLTGAMGASIVYGPDVDPIVSFVYNLFF